jgi:hypothetical protein
MIVSHGCRVCDGTGWERVPGGVKRCQCRTPAPPPPQPTAQVLFTVVPMVVDIQRPAPSNRVETSDMAAAHIFGKLGGMRGRVYNYIRDAGPAGRTCWEVEQGLAMKHSTASGRIYELHGGYDKFPFVFIDDSGIRRKTDGDTLAIVWVALAAPRNA